MSTSIFDNFTAVDPQTSQNPAEQYATCITVTTSGVHCSPGWPNSNLEKINHTQGMGWNTDAAKLTQQSRNLSVMAVGSGQHFDDNLWLHGYGMGDLFVSYHYEIYASGVSAAGDEGQGVGSWQCRQQSSLTRSIIKAVTKDANGATVLTLAGANQFGQDRILVNLTQPSYSTGTAAGTGVGVGTAWKPLAGGMISFAADDVSVGPFGPGDKRLRVWYRIDAIDSDTQLHVYHRDGAGRKPYTGNAKTQGAYTITPGALIASIDGNNITLAANPFVWAVGDTVECAISPECDVTAFNIRVAGYTPGGTFRAGFNLSNDGPQPFQTAFDANAYGAPAGSVGWLRGLNLSGCLEPITIRTLPNSPHAISLGGPNSHVTWLNTGIYYDSVHNVIEINMGNQFNWQVGKKFGGKLVCTPLSPTAFDLWWGGTLTVSGGCGFNGAAAVGQQAITGSRGGSEAVASLIAAFVKLGLVTDSTTP